MTSHFDLDNQLRMATSVMDLPLTRGPLARWQRKNLENSTSSINNSLNASLHLNNVENLNVNVNSNVSLLGNGSLSLGSLNTLSKTPTNTPNKRTITPNRTVTPGRSLKIHNSSHKGKTPKTPIGPDRFIPNRSAMNVEISHYLVSYFYRLIMYYIDHIINK